MTDELTCRVCGEVVPEFFKFYTTEAMHEIHSNLKFRGGKHKK